MPECPTEQLANAKCLQQAHFMSDPSSSGIARPCQGPKGPRACQLPFARRSIGGASYTAF
eukprot:5196490-Alexandrium_andersonii.AAC.2